MILVAPRAGDGFTFGRGWGTESTGSGRIFFRNTIVWYAALYVLSVVAVNLAFDAAPPLTLPTGDLWPPASLVVGFIFVIRDYAQRAIGHWVLPAMLLGGALSWFMADPYVAYASVCAFLTGEFLDWAVYSFTGRPFSQRILLSSAISTPVDSVVFLTIMGMFSVPSVLIMTSSKMVGAIAIFWLARRREADPAAMPQGS